MSLKPLLTYQKRLFVLIYFGSFHLLNTGYRLRSISAPSFLTQVFLLTAKRIQMKNVFLLLGFAAVLSSCAKEDIDDLPDSLNENSKVRTATYGTTTLTYTYDAIGRQVTCDNSDGIKKVYAYSIGNIRESVYKNGQFEYFYKHDLNTDSLCIKEIKSNDNSYEQLYQYNPDRRMVKTITKKNGTAIQVMDFFYSNGNCDSIRFFNNNQWVLTILKTYYTDRINVFDPEVFGNKYFGKGNRNMLRSETFSYPGCTPEHPSNFNYEYDSMGRVIKETSAKENYTSTGLYTYY